MEIDAGLHIILNSFTFEGAILNIDKLHSGYINSTYKVTTSSDLHPNYVLQQINHTIFKNVAELSENCIRITEHIQKKLLNTYASNELKKHVLNSILTKKNKSFHKDEIGNYWRLFDFIEDSKTLEVLETPQQAKAMGRAFGEFQYLLIDLPNPPLFETITDFHNTVKRIADFKEAISKNTCNRLILVKEEIEYLLQFEAEMKGIIHLGTTGKIPLRNVHQDAKLSNVLFDTNNKALCVIDLDTTMPGYLCYDFGDAIRSGMNTAKEDEKNLSLVSLNIPLFKAFVDGYYESSKEFITSEEIKTLAFGAKLITYEQAIRFLEDYLNGDIYYRIEYPSHNLIRTKVQIAFLKELITNFNEMEDYINNTFAKYII